MRSTERQAGARHPNLEVVAPTPTPEGARASSQIQKPILSLAHLRIRSQATISTSRNLKAKPSKTRSLSLNPDPMYLQALLPKAPVQSPKRGNSSTRPHGQTWRSDNKTIHLRHCRTRTSHSTDVAHCNNSILHIHRQRLSPVPAILATQNRFRRRKPNPILRPRLLVLLRTTDQNPISPQQQHQVSAKQMKKRSRCQSSGVIHMCGGQPRRKTRWVYCFPRLRLPTLFTIVESVLLSSDLILSLTTC